jgi:hypothetical protein
MTRSGGDMSGVLLTLLIFTSLGAIFGLPQKLFYLRVGRGDGGGLGEMVQGFRCVWRNE